jgi:YibE/F-like protein
VRASLGVPPTRDPPSLGPCDRSWRRAPQLILGDVRCGSRQLLRRIGAARRGAASATSDRASWASSPHTARCQRRLAGPAPADGPCCDSCDRDCRGDGAAVVRRDPAHADIAARPRLGAVATGPRSFLIPALLAGEPALLVSLVTALAVMFVPLVLTSGFGPQRLAAALGIGSTLLLTAVIALVAVGAAQLDGRTDDLLSYLGSIGPGISLRGIVLAGMVIGALGVLADTAVTPSLGRDVAAPRRPRSRRRGSVPGVVADWSRSSLGHDPHARACLGGSCVAAAARDPLQRHRLDRRDQHAGHRGADRCPVGRLSWADLRCPVDQRARGGARRAGARERVRQRACSPALNVAYRSTRPADLVIGPRLRCQATLAALIVMSGSAGPRRRAYRRLFVSPATRFRRCSAWATACSSRPATCWSWSA